MPTTVAIHQPHYLPWAGLLDKWDRADLLIILDDAQFSRGGWHNRNYILTADGPRLLTVPVRRTWPCTLNDAMVDWAQPWDRRHTRSLSQAYARAPYPSLLRQFCEAVYDRRRITLGDLAVRCMLTLGGLAGITTPTVLASSLGVPGRRSQRLADLCTAVRGDTYLAGDGCAVYLDTAPFRRAGIGIRRQNFVHPVWPQLHGADGAFISRLSAVDLLLNAGPQSAAILRSTRRNAGAER